jgi:hypothetical protein
VAPSVLVDACQASISDRISSSLSSVHGVLSHTIVYYYYYM